MATLVLRCFILSVSFVHIVEGILILEFFVFCEEIFVVVALVQTFVHLRNH